MRLFLYLPLFSILIFTILSASSCQQITKPNYYTLPTYNADNSVNVVVEIPAGTNHKIEYQPGENAFINDTENDKTRVVDYLPYPGNYGFIPSTLMSRAKGGDGDALDVLILGESMPTKSVVATIPIAVLLLKDNGEIDSKIIAVPADSSQQIMQITDFQDFLIEYDAAKRQIEQWFLNYKGVGEMQFMGWKDDKYARQEIEKWLLE
ncbi:MAG: inorganic diphosphatase [Saprospiraceae bacterium]